jgi:hypothetical protein
METTMTFYVIDTADRATTWDLKTESGQSFASRKSAERKAKELAANEPGKVFEIVQSIAEVSCPVGAPKVTER